ncbi:MAG: AraC family transcriptional regulator ligand-binding domain-containing protein [Pseudomonadota bacterium]
MTEMRSGTATPLVSFALSRGLTMSEIQEATGVSCQEMMSPEARLPDDVMPNLWLLLADRFPGAPLTLEMARAAPFSFFGGLAEGAQFADDLRTALKLVVENATIIANRIELRLVETETEARLTSRHPLDVLDGGRSAETGSALAKRLITEFFGIENALMRVTLAHAPHCDVGNYVAFFGVPVEFEADVTALVIRPEKLQTRVQYANLDLFRYVETHFAAVQKQITTTKELEPLTKLRRAAAKNALQGEFGAAAVAAAASMSLRSAQRLTAAHGQSLQSLIENVRENRAKEFLSDHRLDVNSIALLLGYSDERAFRRAFQRWTGQAPSEFRNALKPRQV